MFQVNKEQVRSMFSYMGICLLVYLVVSTIAQALSGVIFGGLLNSLTGIAFEIVYYLSTFLPMYAIAFPITWLLVKRKPAMSFIAERTGTMETWTAKRLVMDFVICVFLMYLGNLIGTGLSAIISSFAGGELTNVVADLIIGSNPFIMAIFVVVIGPIIEELLFRKFLLDRIGGYGERNAMILSGILFGLFHMNLFQFFYAFGIGCLFAFVYLRSHKIRYSIILHMCVNFMGSIIGMLVLSKVDMDYLNTLLSGNADMADTAAMLASGVQYYFIYLMILMVLFIIGFVCFLVRIRNLKLDATNDVVDENEQPLDRKTLSKLTYRNAGIILFILFCIIFAVFNAAMQLFA